MMSCRAVRMYIQEPMPSTANQEGIQKARLVHYPSNADYCQSRGNSEGTARVVRLMPPTASQEGIQKARHMCCLSDAKQKGIQKAWYVRHHVSNSQTKGIQTSSSRHQVPSTSKYVH